MWRQKFHRLAAVPAVLMRQVQLWLCLRLSHGLRSSACEQEAALAGHAVRAGVVTPREVKLFTPPGP